MENNHFEKLVVLAAIAMAVCALLLFGLQGCGGEDVSYDYEGPGDNDNKAGETKGDGGGDNICSSDPAPEPPSEHTGTIERLRDSVRQLEEQLALAEGQRGACEVGWDVCEDRVRICAGSLERCGASLAECEDKLEEPICCGFDELPGQRRGWYKHCTEQL